MLVVHELLFAAGTNTSRGSNPYSKQPYCLAKNLRIHSPRFLLEQEKDRHSRKEVGIAKAARPCKVCLSAEIEITIVVAAICGNHTGWILHQRLLRKGDKSVKG